MPREPPGPTQTSPGTSRGPPQGRFLRLFSRQKMFLLLRPEFYSFFDREEMFLLLLLEFYSFLVATKCSYFYVL